MKNSKKLWKKRQKNFGFGKKQNLFRKARITEQIVLFITDKKPQKHHIFRIKKLIFLGRIFQIFIRIFAIHLVNFIVHN